MNYEANPVGNSISCVFYGISDSLLRDNTTLERMLLDALAQDDFTILGKVAHEFQPQGYTLVVLIAESHAAIHTYPEHGSLVFYLYSCRGPGDGRRTYETLRERLSPSAVDFNERPIIVKKY